MAIEIIDGVGSGRTMFVDTENRAGVSALTESPMEHASRKYGDAAVWTSTYSATAGQEVIAIENDEPERRLRITRLRLSNTVDCLWTLFENTATGPPAGTGITYVNPNLASGVQRAEDSFGNASVTGSLSGNALLLVNTLAEVSQEIFLEGSIVLGKDDIIALTADASGVVAVTMMGFWERPQ